MTTEITARRIGPPSRIYRLVKTNSRRYGFRVETWNRFANRWQLAGYGRQCDIANTLVRHDLAAWAPSIVA
jgi:hypothetical protein